MVYSKLPLKLSDMPDESLYLSQVVDFLNREFPKEKYTNNIIQNYIKSEIISKPYDGRKRGYSRDHIIQLVLLSYMRPILTAEETKKVISIAFNEINKDDDDLITWEQAYNIFYDCYLKTIDQKINSGEDYRGYVEDVLASMKIDEFNRKSLKKFVEIILLITRAAMIKNNVKNIISDL